MQITVRSRQHDGKGYALIVTLIFLAVSLLIFGSMMFWVSSNANVSLRNNQFNMSEAAAEAAVEKVLAQMDRDFLAQTLSNNPNGYYALLVPTTNNWPVQYKFSNTNGTANQISVNLGPQATNSVPLNSQFTGLYGLAQDCTITATATPVGQPYNVPATIAESLQFASIPLFQFAIFYNMNLEIAPGADMTITGPVFCNQNIWEGAADTTYSSIVSAVGTNDMSAADPFANNYSKDGGPTFSLSGQPTSNNDPLTMPIGTNNDPAAIQALLNLPPAAYAIGTTPAYSTNGQVYMANAADLIITNFVSGTNSSSPHGTNILMYYQDSKTTLYTNVVPYDFYLLKTGGSTNYVTTNKTAHIDCTTNVQYAGYSFVTNIAFYDYRESATVQAVQIDIAKFNVWVTNKAANGGNSTSNGTWNSTCNTDKGHPIDSIYVYNSVHLTSTTLPAVRVVNGQVLCPSQTGGTVYGFTVVTPFPMYVLGNYNVQNSSGSSIGVNSTTHTYPAALMADAITILSTNWQDSVTTENPTPKVTTVNAAMLEGIVPTDPSISGDYSGGVENFMRLLENWNNNVPLWYNGSIVVMFPSQYATNHWSYGSYYTAPVRDWAFDANFRQQSKLPPLTPQSKAIIRGQWNASP
jgi:hypothetical protein